MELLGYYGISSSEIKTIKQLLKDCYIIDFNNEIKQTAIRLKQLNKIKLPDAIIASSALYLNCPLLTADKALKKIPDLNFIKLNLPKHK